MMIRPVELFEYSFAVVLALLIGYIGYRFIKALFDAE